MGEMNKFITDEHYAKAEANGLDRKLVYTRVYTHDWDIERAIQEPKYIRKNIIEKELIEIAEKHGVYYSALRKRLWLGWDKVRASTKPLRPYDRRA
jgi:hypothetical protein